MTQRTAAIHESGHAFLLFHGGVPLESVQIRAEPRMGRDEWEGECRPGNCSRIDRIHLIMAAYAGPLAEAKLLAEDSSGSSVQFSCDNSEKANDFILGRASCPMRDRTRVVFSRLDNHALLWQDICLGILHADVAYASRLAKEVGRTDILPDLLQKAKRTLDLPSAWSTVKRLASLLEDTTQLHAPELPTNLQAIFEEATGIDAYHRWVRRGRPLWDDLADWFAAQGRESGNV